MKRIKGIKDVMRFSALCIVLLCVAGPLAARLSVSAHNNECDEYFHVISTKDGLSDNSVLQMLQLADGRMAIKTKRGINLYDAPDFRFLPWDKDYVQELAGYEGQSHLYVDGRNRLWVKDRRMVCAIDLNAFRFIPNPLDSLSADTVKDMYVDSSRDVWSVEGNDLVCAAKKMRLRLRLDWGELQDVDADVSHVYAFCANGVVAAFTLRGRLDYVQRAYGADSVARYAGTSLVVKTPKGLFYQIRTGHGPESAFLRFDPMTRSYQTIYACDYILHTLNMPSDRQALISCQKGYLVFDFMTGTTPKVVDRLALPDGTSLTTGINTVCRDNDGGIWLGTYNDGIIYVSPLLGLFFTIDKPWWQSAWTIAAAAALLLAAVAFWRIKVRRKRVVFSPGDGVMSTGHDGGDDMVAAASEQDAEGVDAVLSVCEASAEDAGQGTPSGFQGEVLALIHEHLADSDYGVEQLARDLCMERTGLYKKLTALTDDTPVSYMRNVRLAKAAEMLRASADGELTVNEIAEQVGFSSPSYFAKCFKAKYGVKPSEYR